VHHIVTMKKTLIGILVLLILLLGGAWVYLLINGAPESVGDIRDTLFGTENFPQGSDAGSDIPPFEETPTGQTIETNAPLIKITSRPTAGATILQNDQGTFVRYMEKGSGNIYDVSLQSGTESLVSQKVISGVVESHWSPLGTHAVLILDSGGSRGETLLATFDETGLTTDSLPTTFNNVFSLDGTTLYYTERNASGGTTAFARNLEAGTVTTLFTVPFAESAVLWDRWNKTAHYIYTKAAPGLMGYLYEVKAGVLEKVDEAFQLTTSRQDSDTVIVNKNSGQGPYSLMLTLEDGRGTFLSLQTLEEKCARARGVLLCAASDAMHAATFPIPWYQGIVSYVDKIYTVDRTTGESTVVADLEALSREQIDVTDIAASDSGQVIFRNKRDDSLWLFNPPL
jgi:hypothetical protein